MPYITKHELQDKQDTIYNLRNDIARLECRLSDKNHEATRWADRYEDEQRRSAENMQHKNQAVEMYENLEERYHELAMAKCPKKLKDQIATLQKALAEEAMARKTEQAEANAFKEAVKAMKGGQ